MCEKQNKVVVGVCPVAAMTGVVGEGEEEVKGQLGLLLMCLTEMATRSARSSGEPV